MSEEFECSMYFADTIKQTKGKKMKEPIELPFKGTASTWWSSDGRVTPVNKLTDKHLENIFIVLKRIAERELRRDNPYYHSMLYHHSMLQTYNPDGTVKFSDKQLEIWLLENCITYPALRAEAMKRKIWNYVLLQVTLSKNEKQPLESILELKIKQLESRIKSLEKVLNIVYVETLYK